MQQDTLTGLKHDQKGHRFTSRSTPPAQNERGNNGKAGACNQPRTVLLMAPSAALAAAATACVATLAAAGHRVVAVLPEGGIPDALAGVVASERVVCLSGEGCSEVSIGCAIKALPARFHAMDAVVNFALAPTRRSALLQADAAVELPPGAGLRDLLKATRAVLPGLADSQRGQVIAVLLKDADSRCQADPASVGLRSELDELGVRFTRIVAGPMERKACIDFSAGSRPRSGSAAGGALSLGDLAQAVTWTLAQPRQVAVRDIEIGPAPQCQPVLSRREQEVLDWTACGKTSEEISCILGLSVSAVNFHVKSLLFKLQCCNRTAAVARAALLGLLA